MKLIILITIIFLVGCTTTPERNYTLSCPQPICNCPTCPPPQEKIIYQDRIVKDTKCEDNRGELIRAYANCLKQINNTAEPCQTNDNNITINELNYRLDKITNITADILHYSKQNR